VYREALETLLDESSAYDDLRLGLHPFVPYASDPDNPRRLATSLDPEASRFSLQAVG